MLIGGSLGLPVAQILDRRLGSQTGKAKLNRSGSGICCTTVIAHPIGLSYTYKLEYSVTVPGRNLAFSSRVLGNRQTERSESTLVPDHALAQHSADADSRGPPQQVSARGW